MEKKKRWQFFVILAVLIWTIYNILPTIIYYSKPLHEPIGRAGAEQIESTIIRRVNQMEEESTSWMDAFCSMVGVKPLDMHVSARDPSIISLEVAKDDDVKKIERFLPRAGTLISFNPAQVYLGEVDGKKIHVVRKLGVRLDEQKRDAYFQFLHKRDLSGVPTEEYFSLCRDRFVETAYLLSGPTLLSEQVELALHKDEAVEHFSTSLNDWVSSFEPTDPISQRLVQTLFHNDQLSKLVGRCEQAVRRLENEREAAAKESPTKQQALIGRIDQYKKVINWLNDASQFVSDKSSVEDVDFDAWLKKEREHSSDRYVYDLKGRNPFVQSVIIDWGRDQLILEPYSDVIGILDEQETELQARRRDALRTMLMNELSWINRKTNENFIDEGTSYVAALSQSEKSNGLIALSLGVVARDLAHSLLDQIDVQWKPESIDLQKDGFPRFDVHGFKQASSDEARLCMIVFSPAESSIGSNEFKPGSLYVVLHGGMNVFSKAQKDIEQLSRILQQRGFVGYTGERFDRGSTFAQDIVFELPNFYQTLLQSTRENFFVPGNIDFALLECGTWEERILAENKVEDSFQEELIKWQEAWQAAQVSLDPMDQYTIPKPTKNLFWSNFWRSWRKYWRGDETRIIRWGLDLSGGKSVRVGLIDQSNTPVTNHADLQQVSSELYTRLNKMGVSERTIRVENETILVDFPGVHDVTASELIKASAMHFHVVNERFSRLNPELSRAVDGFLQEVWNEAVVTNCIDKECVNRIALRKYTGVQSGLLSDENVQTLIEHGLLLEDPANPLATSAFDDQISMIARWDGNDPAVWPTVGHPLMIVFKNYALEGANLDNVHPSYDSTKGNILVFNVRGSDVRGREIRPQEEFYTWTSQFSEEGILGTEREQFSRGRGWRMAVELNGVIVSAPTLSSALRDSAMISGNFSQREVERLSADLQAGSLSFSPKILAEVNVSPELGKMERFQGLVAAALAVIVVAAIMIIYYRFAGSIASLAVLGNLFIIWAVMQNIDAAITLPAIAGIVLTIAMAVDANVLVFERVREEFALSQRIASALSRGYQKALSAIFDSNITTLLAAFILTQFDCGPVRGFALTLIIGLIASMFTALFVTKYYFSHWAANPKHTHLKMMDWIRPQNFQFLSWKRLAFTCSISVIAIGAVLTASSWKTMLGMDFTGGYALVVEANTDTELTPKQAAERIFGTKGVLPSELQIRELGRLSALRIQLSSSLEEPGRPFYDLPESTEGTYEYERMPRLKWVVDALQEGGVKISDAERVNLVQQWTAISGQFSSTMRNNALIALVLALFGVLVYIAVRFEWKYAISAVTALVHDVCITLAILAIVHYFGFPVQINLEVIGALMTIVGYSLNDTIIVFDRVREDRALYRKKRFSEVVNKALNDTLSRTVMTSLTTLAALACLVFFGGGSIFSFSFVMFVGVLLGTWSSLFIAGPLLVFFHHKEEQAG